MKKKLFLILLLIILATNVKAETRYTDYEFVDYTNEKGDDTELTKYVPIKFNRFYKYGETNIVYTNDDKDIIGAPIVDYENVKKETDIVSERSVDDAEHNIIVSTQSSVVNRFRLNNFSSNGQGNNIKEIMILYEDKILSYSIYTYYWVNDMSVDYGEEINGDVIIRLFEDYNIEDLAFQIYYDNMSGIAPDFTLYYMDTKTGIENYKHIYLDNKTKKDNMVTIKFINQFDYDYYLFDNNLYDICYSDICSFFNETKTWYKHYDLGKVYYIDSPLESIDGYVYDENESYNMYMTLRRKIVEEPVVTVEPVVDNSLNEQDSESFIKTVLDDNKSGEALEDNDTNLHTEIIENADEIMDDDIDDVLDSSLPVNNSDFAVHLNSTIEKEDLSFEDVSEYEINKNVHEEPLKELSNKIEANPINDVPYIAYTIENKEESGNPTYLYDCDTNDKIDLNTLIMLPVLLIQIILFVGIIHYLRKIKHVNIR